MKPKLYSYLFVLAAMIMSPSIALACGGLFCDVGPQMVNQAAEGIIFAKHDDGNITAVVQVLYEGDSSEFGWIIPVPGVPEVGVSSNIAFTRLQTFTNPTYQMTTTVEGDCKVGNLFGSADQSSNKGANNIAPNQEGVIVAAEGNVGPYDFVVIEIPNPEPNGAQVALNWLEDNNYMAPEGTKDLFQAYLSEGMNLLAFKLTKNSDAGDIRPIIMKYKSDTPMIPIKLTAVAADDEMGVLVWVLGSERALPSNYKSLEINDSLLNWFNLTSQNYNDVIIRAANEAGGQGFVTEMSDRTQVLEDVIYSADEARQWRDIMSREYTTPISLLSDIESYLSRLNGNCFDCTPGDVDGVGIAIENAFPQASGTTRDKLEQCLSCNVNAVDEGFDIDRVRNAFNDWVAEPLKDTQALIDSQKYFTRLYTTLSAPEMTLDPLFEFNASLKNVTKQHTAERIIECSSSVEQGDAPWRVVLPSGLKVRGFGTTWPIETQDPELPANIIIREGGKTKNDVVVDNIGDIRKTLDLRNADITAAGGCGGCSSSENGSNSPVLFFLFGLFLFAKTKRKK